MFNEKIFKANFFARGGVDHKGDIQWGIAPIFSWGPPGTGKTAKVNMLAKMFDCDFVHTITLGNETPATIGGAMFPSECRRYFERLPAKWVHDANHAKRALIVFDEFGDAPALMQACAQKVINERIVGDTPLGGHVRFACFGNNPDMSTNPTETGMAAANRGGHEDLVYDQSHVNAWMQWMIEDGGEVFEPERIDGAAEEARVSARFATDYAYAKGVILSYVKAQRVLLDVPAEGSVERTRAWLSPRTNEFVTRWIAACLAHDVSDIDRDHGIKMFIGEKHARLFASWRNKAHMPDVAAILDGTEDFKHNPSRPDATMHVTSMGASLILSVKDNREQRCSALYSIMASICETTPDLCLMAAQALIRVPFKSADKRKVTLHLFDADEIVRAS